MYRAERQARPFVEPQEWIDGAEIAKVTSEDGEDAAAAVEEASCIGVEKFETDQGVTQTEASFFWR